MKKSIDLRDKKVFVPLKLHIPAGEETEIVSMFKELYGKNYSDVASKRVTVDPLDIIADPCAALDEEEKRVFMKAMKKLAGVDFDELCERKRRESAFDNEDEGKTAEEREQEMLEVTVPLMLHVDSREPHKIKEMLQEEYKRVYPTTWQKRIVFEQKDTSDYHFTKLDPDLNDTNEPYGCIIERATISDCWNKIQSKNFYTQKNKMVSTNMPRHNIFYLFEGDVMDHQKPSAQNAVASAMVSTNIRDGFSCVQVRNMQCTVRWILDKHMRLEIREESELRPHADNGQARFVDMNTNKRYYSGENRMISILCSVNGVSPRIAAAVQAVYPYFDDLVNAAFEECRSGLDPHLILSNIKLVNKHGKSVRLGNALSRAVIDKFDICRFTGMTSRHKCSHNRNEELCNFDDELDKDGNEANNKSEDDDDDDDDDEVDKLLKSKQQRNKDSVSKQKQSIYKKPKDEAEPEQDKDRIRKKAKTKSSLFSDSDSDDS